MTSLLTTDRINVIRKLAQATSFLSGNCAEVGVYKGGTAKVIAESSPNKHIYLFDTFTGIPMKGENDCHNVGDFKDTTLTDVQNYLKDNKNVSFHIGWFPRDTGTVINTEQFCFVHLDADQYQSTKEALEVFYPKMVKGGIIVFDDYEWKHCPGVKKALDEFLVEKPEKVIVEVPQQCYIIKQ